MGNFVQQFQQASWYPQVEKIMQQYGVPDSVWMSIVETESGGNASADALDPNATNPNAHSYGLFQLNDNSQGMNPTYSANWAAPRIAHALQGVPANASPIQVMQNIENAGWPGMANSAAGINELPKLVNNYNIATNGTSQSGAQFTGVSNPTATTTPAATASPTPTAPFSLWNPNTYLPTIQGWGEWVLYAVGIFVIGIVLFVVGTFLLKD